MADEVKTINANVVHQGADGKFYETHSYKPSEQKKVATAVADIAVLKQQLGDGSGEESLTSKVNALRNEFDTFMSGETDNEKMDTLKELVGQINENTTNITDILAGKVDKANVVNSTKIQNEDEDYAAYAEGTASDEAKTRIEALPTTLDGKVASAALVKALETAVADNATEANNTYRKIADSYTKTEVDNKIAATVQVVNELPETLSAGVTYVVVDADAEDTSSGD